MVTIICRQSLIQCKKGLLELYMKGEKGFMRISCKKALAAMLAVALFAGLMPAGVKAFAAKTPGRPKISCEAVANGSAVVITIEKNKKTDGYDIYVKKPGEKTYSRAADLYKTGKKVRKCVIRTPEDGEYAFKVRAYFFGKDTRLDSKFSRVKKLKVEGEKKELSDVTTGDYVRFGSYEQDGDEENGKEPIEWMVLSNKDSKLFLLSRYVLEPVKINVQTDEEVTYENCGLRKWLNEDFLERAFDEDEASVIATTTLEDVGTEDKVFLLSWDEAKNAEYGFPEKMDRRSGATEYSRRHFDRDGDGKKESVDTCPGYLQGVMHYTYDGDTACYWWLRTLYKEDRFMLIGERGGWTETTYWGKRLFSGHDDGEGDEMFYIRGFGVRPAIVVDLNDESAKLVKVMGRSFADQKTITEIEAGF